MFFFTYTAAFIATFLAVLAAFVFIRAQKDSRARYLSYEMFAACLWIGGNVGADISHTEWELILWSGLAFIGASLMVSFFLVFVDIFIDHDTSKWRKFIYLFPSICFSLFAFSSYSVQETIFPPAAPAQIVPGILYTIYPFFFFASIGYGLLRLAMHMRHTKGRARHQSWYLLIGFSSFFLGNLIFDVILPLYGEYRYYSVGPQFAIVLFICSVYAIFKHQLIDIRIVIQRGLLYSIVLGFIVALYEFFVAASGIFFEQAMRVGNFFAAITTIAIGIWGAPIIERYLRKATDPIFFKDTYDYALAMRELTEILNRSVHTESIIREGEAALVRILRAQSVALIFLPLVPEKRKLYGAVFNVLWGEEGAAPRHGVVISQLPGEHVHRRATKYPDYAPLRRLASLHNAEVVLPIMLEKKILGALFVGSKRSGDSYTREDMNLLENFSSQLAVAFEKALLYEHVREYSVNLERKVGERTREVMALREHEQQMMVDISHGLQTPLTILKSKLGELKHKHRDIKDLDSLEASIDIVSKFIYDLLKLARLDTCKDEQTSEKINLSELVSDLVEYVEVTAQEHGIHMTSTIASPLYIFGNRTEITDAIINLLANAVKYIGAGTKKEITVTLTEGSGNAVLRISDTGIGIPKDDIPHLFERFYRVHNAETRKEKGTGLGLAIVKCIVERHRGNIDVTSVLNSGTTFTITLPLAQG